MRPTTSRTLHLLLAGLLALSLPLVAKKAKGGSVAEDGKDHIALGELSHVNREKGTFQIEGILYRVSDKCNYIATANKKPTGLADFKDGDSVTLTYHDEKGEKVVTILGEQGGVGKGGKKAKKKSE